MADRTTPTHPDAKTARKAHAMTTMTDQHVQDLTDLLSTAVEGGIGYWCAVSGYRTGGPASGRGVTVDAWAVENEGQDGIDLPKRVTLEDLDRAVRTVVIARPDGKFVGNSDCLAACAALLTGRDPDFDADTADQVFQVALMGEAVFG